MRSDEGHENNASHDQKIEQDLENQHDLALFAVIISRHSVPDKLMSI